MVQIRSARPGDDAALVAIEMATWSPDVTPGPPPDRQRVFLGDRTRPEDVLVAELDGRVAGYAMLHQSIPVRSHDHVVEINGLAVDPACQGRGLGRALVEAAKQQAVRRGARKVSLRVLAPNASARRVYEACGFVVEGVLRGEFWLQEQLVDDVLMAFHTDTEGRVSRRGSPPDAAPPPAARPRPGRRPPGTPT